MAVKIFIGICVGGIGGFLLGGMCGAMLTWFNNAVLVPRGLAATGSFEYWILFMAVPMGVVGAIAGAVVGASRSH